MKLIEEQNCNLAAGLKMRAFRSNPRAMSNIAQMLSSVYRIEDAKAFKLHGKYHHVYIAAADGWQKDSEIIEMLDMKHEIIAGETLTLREILGGGAWIPTDNGVVNCVYAPGFSRVEGFYVRRKNPAMVLPLQPLFKERASLVADRKAARAGAAGNAGMAASGAAASGAAASGAAMVAGGAAAA